MQAALGTKGNKRDAWPLKSTGDPGRGLFSMVALMRCESSS